MTTQKGKTITYFQISGIVMFLIIIGAGLYMVAQLADEIETTKAKNHNQWVAAQTCRDLHEPTIRRSFVRLRGACYRETQENNIPLDRAVTMCEAPILTNVCLEGLVTN